MKHLKLKALSKVLIAAGVLIVLNVITVLLGETISRLTVVNKTPYFLHITIGDAIYPYIAPEGNVFFETTATPTLKVHIVFSPGQGMGDKIIDTTITIPYTPPVTTTEGNVCNCEDDDFHCSTINQNTAPAQGGSKVLEIKLTNFH
jgi:hypothetical protein